MVLGTDPKLDTLLAAAFALRLLTGRPLPEGCRAFARYALVERPEPIQDTVPFEDSIEGISLAKGRKPLQLHVECFYLWERERHIVAKSPRR